MKFKDRVEAGEKLASALSEYEKNNEVIVLGLPRGGVVLSQVVARKLKVKMDIIVSRKICFPDNPEFAIGAINEDGKGYFNNGIIKRNDISQEYIDEKISEEKNEIKRRLKVYRGDFSGLELKGRIVIIVDDGIATGATILAAIKKVKMSGAKKIVVAVPVGARESLKLIKKYVDEVVCLFVPFVFGAVGYFYDKFEQVEDDEVVEIMKEMQVYK